MTLRHISCAKQPFLLLEQFISLTPSSPAAQENVYFIAKKKKRNRGKRSRDIHKLSNDHFFGAIKNLLPRNVNFITVFTLNHNRKVNKAGRTVTL